MPNRGSAEWLMMSTQEHLAYLKEKHRKIRLAYARRMGRRLANITKHGEAITDLSIAATMLRQYGVENQFLADAIFAGRQKNARLAEAA
jgi:hypothetical protein